MMEHKAYTFDFASFDVELRPILEKVLRTGELDSLIDFIVRHLENLSDPYEGEPLNENWEQLIESRDPHQYGDFALTNIMIRRRISV